MTDRKDQPRLTAAERAALNDIGLDSPAVVRSDGSWAAPSELLGDEAPAQPKYDEDDEVAQGYLRLMREKGIQNPLPLWGQTLSRAEDGSVLWAGPDGAFYALTGPGGHERSLERARRKRQEQEEADDEGARTD